MTFLDQLKQSAGLLSQQVRSIDPFGTYKAGAIGSPAPIQGVPQNYFDPRTGQFMMPEISQTTSTSSNAYRPGTNNPFLDQSAEGLLGQAISSAQGLGILGRGGRDGQVGTGRNFGQVASDLANPANPLAVGAISALTGLPIGLMSVANNAISKGYLSSLGVEGDVAVGQLSDAYNDALASGLSPKDALTKATLTAGVPLNMKAFELANIPELSIDNMMAALDPNASRSVKAQAAADRARMAGQGVKDGFSAPSKQGQSPRGSTVGASPGSFGAANAAARAAGFAGAVSNTNPNTGIKSAVTSTKTGKPVGYGRGKGTGGGATGPGGNTSGPPGREGPGR